MPSRVDQPAPNGVAIRQIVTSSSDGEFLDHLIEGMKDTNLSDLHTALEHLESDRAADIEQICTSNHQEFVHSVDKLNQSREDCTSLGIEILNLVQSYQKSTDDLAAQKKNLVDSRSVRQNINESSEALKECLESLRLANNVHDLVAKKNHYAALRALEELQSSLRMHESSRYKIGDLLEKSIPATQKMIAEAVMNDLNTWLYRIRDVSQFVGEVAFHYTGLRRERQKDRIARDEFLGDAKLNTPIELIADETEEYDVLNNEEAKVHVDFTPLFECIHIHEALGQSERFRSEYALTRRRQKDLTIPTSLILDDEEVSDLKTLLESIAGFVIVERATMKRTENLRTSADVDELWDSMCQNAISLMSNAVHGVENAEVLLRVTSVISLFIQTMETWQFYNSSLNAFLMTLFKSYAKLLKKRYEQEFYEIVTSDDYMPMPLSNVEEYDKIIDVIWFEPEKTRDEITFPHILPFSQMYPMSCIDIRNFLNQVYTAPDDYLQHSSEIDETIRSTLDELLIEQICQPLIDRLSFQIPSQIVQILTNLEHFEKACKELQVELTAHSRASRSKRGAVTLQATTEFRDARNKAEKRIFELVNSKIDDLIETADYDWSTNVQKNEPTPYMSELTQYVANIMSSVLLGLPIEIKELVYFDALSHAATKILTLPLDPSVTAISPAAVHNFQLDVRHLSDFVSTVSLPSKSQQNGDAPHPSSSPNRNDTEQDQSNILRLTFNELTQTVSLMASENPEDEFFDISQRNRKFASVDPTNGVLLLEKVDKGKKMADSGLLGRDIGRSTTPQLSETETRWADRFRANERLGNVMRGFRKGGDDKGTPPSSTGGL